jgi:hypothetical protein
MIPEKLMEILKKDGIVAIATLGQVYAPYAKGNIVFDRTIPLDRSHRVILFQPH